MLNTNSLIAQGNIPEGYGGSGNGAAIKNPALGDTLNSLLQGDGTSYFSTLLPNLVGLCYIIGTIIFFFMLIMGGIQWISSSGDKQALEGARGKITNALIGLVILFSTFAIINLIEVFFKVKIMTLDIGSLVIQ